MQVNHRSRLEREVAGKKKSTKSQVGKKCFLSSPNKITLSETMWFVLQNTPKSAFQKQVCVVHTCNTSM